MNRPPPLRTDGSNEFARYSMQVRVPRIVRDVLERNPDYPGKVHVALESLAHEIESNARLPAPRTPAPDVEAWTAAHAEHAHETWLDAEWFHAELAVYREVASCSRFWETGRDPFSPAKREELRGDRPWSRLEAALGYQGSRGQRVTILLDECLWANRVDLSYAVAAARGREEGDLLVDEREAAAARLTAPGAHVHVVADNTGTELALDLALVDALLEDPGVRVSVHLKTQPVFVSDALPQDLWQVVDAMRDGKSAAQQSLAERLRSSFDDRRLELLPDPFWSGPRFLWETPPHIARAFASATAVLLKGDANYRRLVGDASWAPEEPFASAAAFMGTTVVCARTMKSDAVLGLPAGLAERLDATDARWRIDGRRGVIQTFTRAGSRSTHT